MSVDAGVIRVTLELGEMLVELQWPELQERRQQDTLTFYKIHNNLITIEKMLEQVPV